MCPDGRGYLIGEAEGRKRIIPAPCNKWGCAWCGPRRVKKLKAILGKARCDRFMTLTCSPKCWADPQSAFTAMSRAFSLLMKSIRRRTPGAQTHYILVWEETKAGWPHLHVIIEGPYIPQAWLSSEWFRLTGARVVDIRKVKNSVGIGSYLAKYLTKALAAPKGFRRWRHGRTLPGGQPLPAHVSYGSDFKWFYWPHRLDAQIREMRVAGFHVTTHLDGSIHATDLAWLARPPSLPSFPLPRA